MSKSPDKKALILFSIPGILISVFHVDFFYYSYDTPKWFFFDLSLCIYLFINRAEIRYIRINWFTLLNSILLLSFLVLSFKSTHTTMAIEFTYRYLLISLTVYCLSTKYNAHQLISLLTKIVLISAIFFVIDFYTERYLLGVEYQAGSFSGFGFINNLGQVLNIWIPVLIAISIRKIKNIKFIAVSVPVTIACVSILMEAGVRACIFGLFIGEGLVFLIMLWKDRKRAILFLSTSMLLLIGIGVYTTFDSLQSGKLSNKASAMENAISSSKARLTLFSNTFDMILDNPFGVGTNNFEYIHPLYGKPGTQHASPYINEEQILRTPHNILLKIYSEQGWIGGSLFLVIISWLYLVMIHNAVKGAFMDRWLLVAGTALFFHSMLSAVFLTPGSLFFSILLFAVVIKRKHELQSSQAVAEIQLSGAFPAIYALITTVSCIILISEFYAYSGFRTYRTDDLKTAIQLNPYNDRALYTLSYLEYKKYHNVEASLHHIDNFLSIYPYHIAANQIKSERLFQLKRYSEADSSTQSLLNYYPTYVKAIQLKQLIQRTRNHEPPETD